MTRILFIRHGQSEGNVDEPVYMAKGDAPVGLTDTGWQQAIRAGRFLQGYLMGTDTKDWPFVFVSSYQRTKETLSGLIHGMKGYLLPLEGPVVKEEPRLIEKFFGASLRIRTGAGPLDWRIAAQLWAMAHEIFHKDKFTTRNMLGDSRKDIYMAAASFVEGPLARALASGQDDIIIVSHGAFGHEFLRVMAGLPMDAKIPDIGNCDVIEFVGEPGNWNIRKLYDGPAMRPSGEAIIEHIKPLTLADLPPVPGAFQ